MTEPVHSDDFLSLETLRNGVLPGISCEYGASCCQAATVCLTDRGHSSPVGLTIVGDYEKSYNLEWRMPDEVALATWNDLPYTTEQGAYGIAFLLILALTPYTIIRRSRKGTGFDYALGHSIRPLNFEARLEVSGLLAGSKSSVARRSREKVSQVHPSDASRLTAYIVVVEFGKPSARITKHDPSRA